MKIQQLIFKGIDIDKELVATSVEKRKEKKSQIKKE